MIKIITALGNPSLNNELKKYEEFNVIGNDIMYFDGVLEFLELNSEIDYLILGEIIDINNLNDFIDKVINNNRKIKIIVVINKKNKKIEDILLKKGILDIFYDDIEISEIVNFLKTKNIEYLNIELRSEINNLKKLLNEKNNKKISKNKKIILNNRENKIIGITGARGIGKTSFCVMLANSLKNKKVLIIDFDLINSQINDIYNKKFEYAKIDELNINNYIFNVHNNIDILIGLNILYYYNKLNLENFKIKINNIREKYDYILIDTYSEYNFDKNKYILNMADKIFLLTGLNKLEINKTRKLINILIKKWQINNKKINIIYYKFNILEYLINKKIINENIFENIKIIGKIKNEILFFYNIKNNYKFNFINKFFCKKIISKLS